MNNNLKGKISAMGLSIMLFFLAISVNGSICAEETDTELEIISIKGGFGAASFETKNIGNVTAEDLNLTISVKGGFLDRIDITKVCTGCSDCGTTLEPDATRSESTAEEGRIFGFGRVEISVSAYASNAAEVTDKINGFVLGFIVIIV